MMPGRLQREIIKYLITHECASVKELMQALESLLAKSKDPKHSLLHALSRLHKQQLIERRWITTNNRVQRIYCLNS